jgi:N-acetylglucosaminyldiphosphoundecaprenol N-acetyl-beta-D-mannosaminyltransferase
MSGEGTNVNAQGDTFVAQAEPRWQVLDLPLDLCTAQDLTERIVALARTGGRHHAGHLNLHALAVARQHPVMERFYSSAALCHADGMAIVSIARLCGVPARRHHRVTWVDLIWPLMRAANDEGLRVFSLGGKPGTGARAADRLRAVIPGLEIEAHHGYFDMRADAPEHRAIIDRIRRFEPNLLLVGMGMPRQERWILEQRDRLPPCVSLTMGGCMDYISGDVPTPPRWTGRVGLEWLPRLVIQPRRLAWRCFVEPWQVAVPLAKQIVRRPRGVSIGDANRP